MSNPQDDIVFGALATIYQSWNEDSPYGDPQHGHNIRGLWDGDAGHPKGAVCVSCAAHDILRLHVRNTLRTSVGLKPIMRLEE